MYAQNAYVKQREENLLPTRSPPQRRRREVADAAEAGLFQSSVNYSSGQSLNYDFNAALETSHNDRLLASKRRRVKKILLFASLAFVALLVIDGMAKFHYLPEVTVETVYETAEHYERKLIQHRQEYNNDNGVVRRLVGALLGEEEATKQHPRLIVEEPIANTNNKSIQQRQQRALLHTLPLLPRHALQHRKRRELIAARKPLPRHLQENVEDEMYHAPPHQRRRAFTSKNGEMNILDTSSRHLAEEESIYETGALYQGYGTHYLDLWVGSPPQRMTVIIDTGSSITAFPCSGCFHCGDNPATGEIYHLDEDFDKFRSSTYQQFECAVGQQGDNGKCPLGKCKVSNAIVGDSEQVCQMEVSYAEGSSWTAVGGSDVCYPGGSHEHALVSNKERMAEGVGVGMGKIETGRDFDWMDFRLKFGCQTKVTGLFRSQLEDGIMGMDGRPGSFWQQLRDHYKSNGVSGEQQDFDPNLFALCYDRQPISSELPMGVGSGALTLGGSDSLFHSTPMVFAENVTPRFGWYTVHMNAMFLRSRGGSLSEPASNARYVRVDADETTLNGNTGKRCGVIVDSGTTDTYLPSNLKSAFNEAWKEALRDPNAEYHNNHIEMTAEQVKTLPTILVVLQGYNSGSPETYDAVGMAGHPSHASMFNSINDDNPLNISKNDVVVAISPEHYMEESHSKPGTWIARIYFTERFGQQSIFGSSFMMGHEILFDNSLGRVGFSESHCDYSRYMEERDLQLERGRDSATSDQHDSAVSEQEIKEYGHVTQLDQDSLHSSGWT